MSRKRNLRGMGVGVGGRGGVPGWDTLPWKTIEPPLERDDGWKSMGGDEQALLYTLEEISGTDYSLQTDSLGGSQVVVAGTAADELTTDRATGGGAEGGGTAEPATATAATDGGNPAKGKKKGKKRKAKLQGGETKEEEEEQDKVQTVPAGAAVGTIHSGVTATGVELAALKGKKSAREGGCETVTVSPSASEGNEAAGVTGGAKNVDGAGRTDDDGMRPRRKKRRGQGKKNRAAAAAAVAEAVASVVTASSAAQGECREKADEGNTAVSIAVTKHGLSGTPPGSEGGDAMKARVTATATAVTAAVAGPAEDGEAPPQKVIGARRQHTGQEGVAEEEAAASAAETAPDSEAPTKKSKKKSNKKKKKKKKKKKNSEGMETGEDGEDGGVSGAGGGVERDWELGEEESAKMSPWMYLGVELHPALLWHLHRQGFHDPTPIQNRVLPKAILGRKDIIGAAETGSGKTLAFGLPVLNEILTRRDAVAAAAAEKESEEALSGAGGAVADGGLAGTVDAAQDDDGDEMVVAEDEGHAKACGGGGGGGGGEDVGDGHQGGQGLQALVLCPTRELALQVAAHLREVVGGTGLAVVAVVGGLAEVKQERQLSRRPEVVVATPGRFWELTGTHAHLSRLETLRHLVIDEADRMLERGHFPELNRLFDLLGKAEGRDKEGGVDGRGGGISAGGGRGGGRKNAGRAGYKSTFPFDISEGGEWSVPVENSPFLLDGGSTPSPQGGIGVAMDESEDNQEELDNASSLKPPSAEDESPDDDDEEELDNAFLSKAPPGKTPPTPPPRDFARQTYVFSATLTLGASGRQRRKKAGASAAAGGGGKGKGRGGKGKGTAEDDPVAKIMKRVGVRGEPAVIDMGRRTVGGGKAEGGGGAGSAAGAGEEAPPALPATLRLCSIKSLQMEKDIHAYLFCAMYPGRTLIFVNAIVCARRLSELLCALRVPATPLHAQMQQRQRLKSLDRFSSNHKAVLVATDVAARGLDIPKVEHVVHYDAARSAEVFIHRAGRTARARAAGLSLSIVAPRDDANHRQTCSVLGLHDGMRAFPMEVRLVDRARERVGMALRVLKFQEQQNKVSASNDFFRGMSRDADLVVDGDLLMDHEDAASENRAQGRRGGVKGLGRRGNQHAARLAAEARQALEASLSHPLHSDRRKLFPVAQALTDMKKVSARTASGDLAGRHETRGVVA